MRGESDLHKSHSEPRLSISAARSRGLLGQMPRPATMMNGGTDSQESLNRPRLVIDRPVWTMSDCYQMGSDDAGLVNPGFSSSVANDLNHAGGGGGHGVSRVSLPGSMGSDDRVSKKSAFAEMGDKAKYQIKKKIVKTKESLCTPEKVLRMIISLFPCIGWMRTYKIKEYLVYDIISGITSAIFHVPQGMANALANGVAPVYGLYGSFFPSAVYSVMGTSMQCSVGTFTVVSIITANAVHRLATGDDAARAPPSPHTTPMTDLISDHNGTSYYNGTSPAVPGKVGYTAIEVTVAVALLSGVIQVILGICRCGRLGILISPSLASGFMTGCAVQIIASQLKGCFNLQFKDFTGVFSVLNTFGAVFENIGDANMITSVLSLCVCVTLIVGKDLVGPKFQKLCRIPLPVDLIMVVVATVVSYYLELNKKYKVPIVNSIPKGLPSPQAPPASLLPKVIGDAIAVAIVGFASTFSMGKTFARRYNHEVDANQELLALGCGNILGGFFLCLPGCGSLARSSVMESVGCKTQLTGMISCVFLALVLYFIGPLLEPLPKCVLATILATALKSYLFNIVEVKKLWNVSKADAIIWVTTCASVIILDVTYGLIVGVIITLLSVTWRMQGYRGTLLREVKTSGIFLPKNKKKKVNLAPDQGKLILFRFGNPLCFATAANFVADVKRIIKQIEQAKPNGDRVQNVEAVAVKEVQSYLVVDLSSTCFVDNTGVEALHEAIEKCEKANVEFALAALPDNVVHTLQRSGTMDMVKYENVFPTIQDAVLAVTSKMSCVDNVSACVSFAPNQTDVNGNTEDANSIGAPPRSTPSLRSELDVQVKDMKDNSSDEEEGEEADFAKMVNFCISENGRMARASIISTSDGHILRSSYL